MTMREPSILRIIRRAVEILLWCGAAIGTFSIVAAIAVASFGIVPLVFLSGSMSPEVPTGSLGLAHTVAASELLVGDIVSVTAANKTRVTHRVVAIEQQSDVVALTLQGDTNPAPDQETYTVTEVDRVFFTVPYLGRIIMILTSPWGMFFGGLTAAVLLFWVFRRRPPATSNTVSDQDSDVDVESAQIPMAVPPVATSRHRTHQMKFRMGAIALAVGVPALLLSTVASGTVAYFSDTANVTTTGFVTHRVLQPGPATCSAASNAITLGTTPLPNEPRYTYWARAYTPTGDAISGYKQMTGSPTTVTASFNSSDFTAALAPLTTYTVRIHSRVGAPGPTGSQGWESDVFQLAEFSKDGTLLKCGEAIVPPNIVFVRPIDGYTGTRDNLQGLLNADCDSIEQGICGTAIDPNGSVVSVEYLLRRSSWGTYCYVPGGSPNGYPAFGSCTFRPAVLNGNKWSIPGPLYGGLQGWNYQLTIRATDNLGAVTEQAIRFRVNP